MIAQNTSYTKSPVAIPKACGSCTQPTAAQPTPAQTISYNTIPFWIYIIIALLIILLIIFYLHKEKK